MSNLDQILYRLNDIEKKLEEFQKQWEKSHNQLIIGLKNHLDEIEKTISQSNKEGPLGKTIFERLNELEKKIDKINKD